MRGPPIAELWPASPHQRRQYRPERTDTLYRWINRLAGMQRNEPGRRTLNVASIIAIDSR